MSRVGKCFNCGTKTRFVAYFTDGSKDKCCKPCKKKLGVIEDDDPF